MTGAERFRAVYTGLLPDQVPYLPTLFTSHACVATGRRFVEGLIDPALGNRCMLEAALLYRADAVRLRPEPPASWYEVKRLVEEGGALVQYDQTTGHREGVYDVAGGGGFVPDHPPAFVASVREAEAIAVTTAVEYRDRGSLAHVEKLVAQAHDQGLFAIGMCAGQTLNFMVQQMGSSEAALLSFYDRPELARALIDKAVAISCELMKAFVAAGADCIYIGDSYASASVISPAVYQEFCAPAYRRMADAVHAAGAFCYKHCCGSYNPLLEHLPAIGLDGMDGIDPTSGMSVSHTKAAIGEHMVLMGGISCLTLLDGTPEQVYEEARQCIEAGKPGGRYVLGSACAVPPEAPAENLQAARRAVDDFGVYGC